MNRSIIITTTNEWKKISNRYIINANCSAVRQEIIWPIFISIRIRICQLKTFLFHTVLDNNSVFEKDIHKWLMIADGAHRYPSTENEIWKQNVSGKTSIRIRTIPHKVVQRVIIGWRWSLWLWFLVKIWFMRAFQLISVTAYWILIAEVGFDSNLIRSVSFSFVFLASFWFDGEKKTAIRRSCARKVIRLTAIYTYNYCLAAFVFHSSTQLSKILVNFYIVYRAGRSLMSMCLCLCVWLASVSFENRIIRCKCILMPKSA